MTITRLLFLASLLFSSLALKAEPIVLSQTFGAYAQPVAIDVPAGKRFSIKAIFPPPGSQAGLALQYQPLGKETVSVFNFTSNLDRWGKAEWLVGPATVYVFAQGGYPVTGAVIYELLDINAVDVTPSNAVVIPQDANGVVQIILESSVDMITWTAAQPGTYVGSTEKRFFRVRAVKQ